MAVQKGFLVVPVLAMVLVMADAQNLTLGYYNATCPDAENIVRQVTEQHVKQNLDMAAGLLRLNFHDCVVRGCEASVLLDSAPGSPQPEKAAIPNLSLRGFEIIDAIKKELEAKCPGVVSCADVLALAARDAVRLVNGPFWEVTTGRKDGRVSSVFEAFDKVPTQMSNITTLKQGFFDMGLTTKDLVVLSGSHTIGVGHCYNDGYRLYNFTGKWPVTEPADTDPSLEPAYAASIRAKCKPDPEDFDSTVYIDQITPQLFDEKYYTMLTQKKGLFTSDSTLMDDPETRSYVELQATTNGSTFAKDFADSMVKMIQIGVLTGNQGEVRKDCRKVN